MMRSPLRKADRRSSLEVKAFGDGSVKIRSVKRNMLRGMI